MKGEDREKERTRWKAGGHDWAWLSWVTGKNLRWQYMPQFFWTNDSGAGIDDRLRFGYTLRTTSPNIKCLTSQTRPFWFPAVPLGRDSDPLECDIANHDAKITLCICGCLVVLSGSSAALFLHVCVHLSVLSLTADQNTHSASGTFGNFDFFSPFFFF